MRNMKLSIIIILTGKLSPITIFSIPLIICLVILHECCSQQQPEVYRNFFPQFKYPGPSEFDSYMKKFNSNKDDRSIPPNTTKQIEENPNLQIKPEANQKEGTLQHLIQELYMAQAEVQLEASEIQRSQTIAAAAQQQLEESANNVRVITSGLHAAQEAVASAAIRAETAQLQLAAHDQLLFTARQKVDALSARMVGLEAEIGIGDSRLSVDLPGLLNRLKEPLKEDEKPTPVPSIIAVNSSKMEENFVRYPTEAKYPFSQENIKKRSTSDQISENDVKELLSFLHSLDEKPLESQKDQSGFYELNGRLQENDANIIYDSIRAVEERRNKRAKD